MNQYNTFKQQHSLHYGLLKGGVLLLLLSLIACQSGKQAEKKPDSQAEETRNETSLMLNDATLEQSNEEGKLIWKIQVDEAKYSPDRKKANLTAVKGNIFQDGKIVLQIKADQGEIYRDGTEIFLKKNILAVDPRNKAVIRSQEVEWRPKDSLLIVRKDLKGSHPQLEVSAKEGKYNTREQKLELTGQIVGTSEKKSLLLKTEHLIWEIPKQTIIADRLLKLARFQNKIITDNLTANRATVHLDKKQVVIKENIEFKSVKPPVQVASNEIIWNYKTRQVRSEKPVKLIHYQDNVTITGNQAQVEFAQNIAYLKGGVQGSSQSNEAKLYANNLTWNMASQTIEAVGNVIYEQHNPQFNLTGEKAVGTLNNKNIIVTNSNRQERVVTEIFPDQNQ
ncbi:LPS export ABC transporter periplasmic protein LptC [Crocosphaera sp. XPORK-15E]|uniref:LPS export ABC transporter periplasmic protein LptC n=1 Tax=Crocosphaera sp. XPORK-15E TaxID=3110247 RepID=UPI002B202F88|nr:LPS export ABC transporter periplasmic protein LptC [Crocosphaera sp. XPORK-15E]MEA5534591.1 LPS export ABC transporter periplasmic protein LptC [Crocosphaera sp. XPORK-15E]